MPVQKFAPMTKNFPTFDCDAHVTEPPWILGAGQGLADQGRAGGPQDDHVVRRRDQAAHRQWPRRRGPRLPAYRRQPPAYVNVLSLAGPGLKHDIQRTLNVRNLNRQDRAHQGTGRLPRSQGLLRAQAAPARHGRPGYRPGDDHSHRHRYLSLAAECAGRARRCARPTTSGPTSTARRIPSGSSSPRCCRCRIPRFAVEELYRVAAKGCRVGADPSDRRDGQLSDPAQVRVAVATRWKRPAWFTGCIRFPRFGALKPPGYTEQYSGAELISATHQHLAACRTSS